MRWSLFQWLHLLMYAVIVVETESIYVNITYVRNAVAKGAGEDFFRAKFFVFLNDFYLHFYVILSQFVLMEVHQHTILIGDMELGIVVG